MKAWLKVILFIMAFQLEVRVKASDIVLENPENCLASQNDCIVKVREPAYHHKNEKFKFHATKNSVLERKGLKTWKLIDGQMWIESAAGTVLETIYGSAKATHGEYWISTVKDKIFFRNISSDIEVTLRDGKTVQAPAGFQFWIGGLSSDAKSEYGMIEPIDMKSLLPVWTILFAGTKEDFTTKIRDLRKDWGNLVEVSSQIYRDQAMRKIASSENQKNKESTRIRNAQLAKERLRETYRARVFDR